MARDDRQAFAGFLDKGQCEIAIKLFDSSRIEELALASTAALRDGERSRPGLAASRAWLALDSRELAAARSAVRRLYASSTCKQQIHFGNF